MIDRKLIDSEAQLSGRERYALCGYLLFKDNDKSALKKAYVYSRENTIEVDSKTLDRLADKWVKSKKVQAFIKLWESGAMQVLLHRTQEDMEDENEIQTILQEYKKLYEECNDIDGKARILKMIADVRHRSRKDLGVTDESSIRVFLPLRCDDCTLYKRQKEEIKVLKDHKNE